MAQYFRTKEEAEDYIKAWHADNGSRPIHFAKIVNFGSEKWIVCYNREENPGASPMIQVLEDHSQRIEDIVG